MVQNIFLNAFSLILYCLNRNWTGISFDMYVTFFLSGFPSNTVLGIAFCLERASWSAAPVQAAPVLNVLVN